MATKLSAGEWTIEVDGDYVTLRLNEFDGVVQVKADLDGFAVDIFDNRQEESVSACYATYDELE